MTVPRIFLTGPTGNVGPHLLAHLLDRPSQEVVCLVRASDEERGLSRVRSALEQGGYDAEKLMPRVSVVVGNLGSPRLGLSESAFESLSKSIGHVVHNAAWLGHRQVFDVDSLVNVTGTTAIAELCLRAEVRLDHVSTIGVLRWTLEDEAGVLTEATFTEHPEPPEDGDQYAYYFSKWTAEQLALYAAERVPVTVHRLGDVFSHTADAPLAAVAGAVSTLGSLPDDPQLTWSQHSISDAFAGKAIAAIAHGPPAKRRVLHDIAHVEGISVEDVRRAFAARGVELGTLPIDQWMEQLEERLPWTEMLEDWQIDYLLVPKRPTPRYVNPGFQACLSERGIAIPTAAERLAPAVANVVGS